MAGQLAILFLALVLDRIVGDPEGLWRRIAHPVVVFGRLIDGLDRRFNRQADPPAQRRRNGWLAIAALVGLSLAIGAGLAAVLASLGAVGVLVEIVVVAVLLAQKSLADHVGRVADALRRGGLAEGRRAVAMIVGRDPDMLDEAGIARAAIESLAENFSDGVVAPALWYALLGLPGLFAYKMLNTADSMIGHLSPRHRDFGRGAARLDDLANWPAARLSAVLVALAAWPARGPGAVRRALDVARRDAGLHRSPNAGWPEAAMAGALDIRLAGPRVYGGAAVAEPFVNAAGRAKAGPATIGAALALFSTACNGLAGAVLLAALAAAVATV